MEILVGLRVSRFFDTICSSSSCQADGDTLFLFNYRSDRMREISTVLGQLDKPVDVVVPKDLVCFLSLLFTPVRI
jgi:bisphosphoglycerate-independent phosphoglycerate mutase (AlkP superfamily)